MSASVDEIVFRLVRFLNFRNLVTVIVFAFALPLLGYIFVAKTESSMDIGSALQLQAKLLKTPISAFAGPFNDTYKVCHVSNDGGKVEFNMLHEGGKRQPIFVITPTYQRSEQTAELTRLIQTLSHVPSDIHWIVVEDDADCSKRVRQLIHKKFRTNREKRISYSLLAAKMPEAFRRQSQRLPLPRGVAGRRAALKWIEKNTRSNYPGVIYFADDDNTYDVGIFSEIRKTRRVSMFPVGLIHPAGVSSPVLNAQGKIIGFAGRKRPFRRFPVDMAGFAFSVTLLHEKKPEMPFKATFEEEGFLRSMDLSYTEIEPLAKECTEILVWHTMTAAPVAAVYARPPADSDAVNLDKLLAEMVRSGVAAGYEVEETEEEKTRRGWRRPKKKPNAIEICVGSQCAN